MRVKKKLGEMLLEGGLLTEEQLNQAVANHKKNNMKLGQFLVREGIVSGSQIVDLVSKQLKLKKYRADVYPIDMELSKVIPVEMAQKYHLAPLNRSRFLLTIAMVDPMPKFFPSVTVNALAAGSESAPRKPKMMLRESN